MLEDEEPIPGIGVPPSARQIEEIIRDPDRMACHCHQVPVGGICALLEERRPRSVAEIGAICDAGTGCGSCQGLLAVMLERWKAGQ